MTIPSFLFGRGVIYRVEYNAETVLGEAGYSWRLYANSRFVSEGWSRGKRKDAEQDAKQVIARREGKAA